MMRRLLSVLHARNLEFLRDRGTLVFGMGFVFGGPQRGLFKVGLLGDASDPLAHPFLSERYVEFIGLPQQGEALRKLTHQQIDLLLELRPPERYWVNTDSPKGYI